jgi:hypothetical protein
MRTAYKILVRKPEGERPPGRHRLDGRIISVRILGKESGMAWTGFI